MKILCVHCRNLNSLAGSKGVDFSEPEYTDAGLFAIIGPSGSGKSTILDAISLALYVRTSRLGYIGKGSNEIMSRRTGECSAEVEFEAGLGRYRCQWSQRRARRSAAPANCWHPGMSWRMRARARIWKTGLGRWFGGLRK